MPSGRLRDTRRQYLKSRENGHARISKLEFGLPPGVAGREKQRRKVNGTMWGLDVEGSNVLEFMGDIESKPTINLKLCALEATSTLKDHWWNMNIEEFIERGGFKSVLPQKNGVVVNCPAHEDRSPSLSVRQLGDQIVLKCFAGCEENEILEALDLEPQDIRPPRGCTLQQYAAKTNLPVEFLKKFHLRTHSRLNTEVLLIPWLDENGKEVNRHYRIAVSGKSKFRWDKNKSSKGYLYNIDEVDPKKDSTLVICEGESDVHTLAFHGYQAVGIPGASLWENELLERLNGFEKLYFIIEPDRGGETIFKKLAKTDAEIREKIFFPDLAGFKDPNQFYRDDPKGFGQKFRKVLDEAVSFEQFTIKRR